MNEKKAIYVFPEFQLYLFLLQNKNVATFSFNMKVKSYSTHLSEFQF